MCMIVRPLGYAHFGRHVPTAVAHSGGPVEGTTRGPRGLRGFGGRGEAGACPDRQARVLRVARVGGGALAEEEGASFGRADFARVEAARAES